MAILGWGSYNGHLVHIKRKGGRVFAIDTKTRKKVPLEAVYTPKSAAKPKETKSSTVETPKQSKKKRNLHPFPRKDYAKLPLSDAEEKRRMKEREKKRKEKEKQARINNTGRGHVSTKGMHDTRWNANYD